MRLVDCIPGESDSGLSVVKIIVDDVSTGLDWPKGRHPFQRSRPDISCWRCHPHSLAESWAGNECEYARLIQPRVEARSRDQRYCKTVHLKDLRVRAKDCGKRTH